VDHIIRDERRERRATRWASSEERFDRIEFAMRVLRILSPPGLRIAVYERYHELTVERGRPLASGPSWAMIGIPPHASREHIALALAELAGVARVPFMVDLLAAAGDAD
jgi:hypothetical protein